MRRAFIPLAATFTFIAAYKLAPASSPARQPWQAAPEVAADIHYSGCNEVRAAGRAPLYSGQPGYREDMDGDSDGIACEPHRQR